MQAFPCSLSRLELQRLSVIGKNPDGEMLRQILTRALQAADARNRVSAGIVLHQSQGHAQVLQALIERLDGDVKFEAQQKLIDEPVLFDGT